MSELTYQEYSNKVRSIRPLKEYTNISDLKEGDYVDVKRHNSGGFQGVVKKVNRINIIVYIPYMGKEVLELTAKKSDVIRFMKPWAKEDPNIDFDAMAFQFCMDLEVLIGKKNFIKMVEDSIAQNLGNSNVCLSHDYCDANMAIAAVLERNGYSFIIDAPDGSGDERVNEVFTNLMNKVWDIAKKKDYYIDTLHNQDLYKA